MQFQLPFPSYSVTVNYDQTVEWLIKFGKYDEFNDDITSDHFPSNEKDRVALLIYLVNFNRKISSDDAVKELDREGLRPATLKELLSLGAFQPDLQRNNPIVALGSTWRDSNGGVYVPCLSAGGFTRYLIRYRWFSFWFSEWQFAAVPK